MKLVWALILLASLANCQYPAAEECDVQACQLPNCRCSSTNIPGGLAPRDTPQFVLATFDDAVNVINIETYRSILYNRRNSDNCPIGATFYVSHEYTNYQLINELYNNGFEIALHSISHQTPQTYWAEADREVIEREFVDQKLQMARFANIPANSIQGVRIPFLQLAGNTSFEVLSENDFTYDSSWPTVSFINPGLWPYTLEYASTQDCPINPCPTSSVPGKWVLPMITWRDLLGFPCSMADSCFAPPPLTDSAAWYQFFISNFERHYLNNRAPFGVYIHEWYINAYPEVRSAFVRFMDTINNLPDVFMVNSIDVINWTQNPVPVNEYRNRACPWRMPTNCFPSTCGPLPASHREELFWMTICSTCPRVYPWLGNPFGL